MKKEAIIIANGEFPQNQNLLKILRETEYLICCDGAMNSVEKFGLKPYAIIGDLDSIHDDIKAKYKEIIYHFSEQLTNDLTKSINWSISHGFDKLTILGATGMREDHAIANIFLLMRYIREVEVVMISDYGIFTPILKSTKFSSYKGQQVSILSPYEGTKVKTHNLRYSLDSQILPNLWSGTLNESLADTFEIEFEGKGLLIYQTN